MIEINFKGALRLTREVLPGMAEARGERLGDPAVATEPYGSITWSRFGWSSGGAWL